MNAYSTVRNTSFAAIVVAAAACVSACTAVDPGMGEALKYDMALQTIDPDPVYPDGAAEPGSLGTTAAAAAERYRKGTVKPVVRESTGSGGSGGGSDPS